MKRYIETERLILRSPRESDVPDMCRLKNSEFVGRYNLYGHSDEATVRDEIERYDMAVLEDRHSGAFVGCIYIKEDYIRYNVDSVEVAGWLDVTRARGGVMSEALRALIPVLFDEGAQRLSARVFGDNIASMRLMESVGFYREGYLPCAVKNQNGEIFDLVLYSVTKDEYNKKTGRCTNGSLF